MSIFKTFWLLCPQRAPEEHGCRWWGNSGPSPSHPAERGQLVPWGVCVMDGGQLCPVQMWRC